MMRTLIFMFFHCSAFSVSSVIDYSHIKMISLNLTGSYFGYSIVLQRGNPPAVIVGAPREKHGDTHKGTVYKCDLNNLRCEDYSYFKNLKGTYTSNKNGNFLGSVLDGDDSTGNEIFTCSPRFITVHNEDDYYINGRCFQIIDSNNINSNPRMLLPLVKFGQVAIHNRTPYYNAAFGEAGLNLLYVKDQNEILIGAPGKSLWNGAVIKTSLYSRQNSVLFSYQPDFVKYHDNYYGYAVGWGRFIRNSTKIWYLSGGPRSCNLKGNVIFFDANADYLGELCGEEFGSYFGASLLIVHNNDRGDDVLIGAPMYGGSSFDEGCVYYYKNKKDGNFHSPIKLTRGVTSSRFGTVMADIGDIDLDSLSDCAISAPYENDGVGAVYLYFGTEDGFSNDKYERISPADFAMVYPKLVVKGFGLGLSKGNDVNSDKHNDFVVGAFLTDQVFYFPSNQIVDVVKNITANMETLFTTTTSFVVTYCLTFTFRNRDRNKQRSFLITLESDDDRINNDRNVSQVVTLKPHTSVCKNLTMYLKNNHLNIDPIVVFYGHKLYDINDTLTKMIFNIPVSYECGTDNICQTSLEITGIIADRTKIIIGETNELRVNVTINNSGESAYRTKLYVKLPADISLINLRECDFENGTYVCLVSQLLKGTIEKSFLFDLVNLGPLHKNLVINFSVDSTGQDDDLLNNQHRLNIPILLQNNPHIDGHSTPNIIFLNESEKILQTTHSFLIGNQGPSPIDLNLVILVPELKYNGSDVIEIKSIEGSVTGSPSPCEISTSSMPQEPYSDKILREISNHSLDNCTIIYCKGGFLYKSNENAAFNLKINLHSPDLVKVIGNENKLLIATTAFFQNNTKTFITTVRTVIRGVAPERTISIWIYIISIISGIILLLLLIYVMYKCNFFERSYKERLENEQAVNESFLQDEEQSEEGQQ